MSAMSASDNFLTAISNAFNFDISFFYHFFLSSLPQPFLIYAPTHSSIIQFRFYKILSFDTGSLAKISAPILCCHYRNLHELSL